MFYLLYGSNSYKALRKIREFKEAFLKKGGEAAAANFLVEEIDFAAGMSFAEIAQSPLFSKRRLVILKNALSDKYFSELFREKIEFLKNSPDIFVFWEGDLKESDEAFKLFKKNAEKIQETKNLSEQELDRWLEKKANDLGVKLNKEERAIMMEEAGESGEWALGNELEKFALSESSRSADENSRRGRAAANINKLSIESGKGLRNFQARSASSSPFGFVEKIFYEKGGAALLTLKKAVLAGHIPEKFIYPLLWKAKQKRMLGAYKNGILAESAMRRDPKNAYEHLERFILGIK